jgi:hypothetical protein
MNQQNASRSNEENRVGEYLKAHQYHIKQWEREINERGTYASQEETDALMELQASQALLALYDRTSDKRDLSVLLRLYADNLATLAENDAIGETLQTAASSLSGRMRTEVEYSQLETEYTRIAA